MGNPFKSHDEACCKHQRIYNNPFILQFALDVRVPIDRGQVIWICSLTSCGEEECRMATLCLSACPPEF